MFRERCKPVRDNDGIIDGIAELVGDIRTDNGVIEVFEAVAGLKAQRFPAPEFVACEEFRRRAHHAKLPVAVPK